MSYPENRQWSDRFIPTIKRIVGPLLLTASEFDLDVSEATDLIVFNARDMRIAARIRRQEYALRYPWEFTVRSRLDNGAKTELAKIVDGWGDWMFYGYSEDRVGEIRRWFVINLHSFRAHLIRQSQGGKRLLWGQKPNGDGTHFCWFDLRSFNQSILVSASHNVPHSAAA